MSDEDVRRLRGQKMAMIFQDPLSSLHPFYTDRQAARRGRPRPPGRLEGRRRASRPSTMLDRVGIPNPDRRVDDYPHQLSGGMRQRVDDRHGAAQRPVAAHRRRAHHGARRHRAGADPASCSSDLQARVQHRDHHHHPRPRRRRRRRRRGRRDVRRSPRRARARSTTSSTARRCRTRSGCSASMPRLDRVPHGAGSTRSPGYPPSLINLPKGCVFRPRCTYHERGPGRPVRHRAPRAARDRDPATRVRCHMPAEERRGHRRRDASARVDEPAGAAAMTRRRRPGRPDPAGHRPQAALPDHLGRRSSRRSVGAVRPSTASTSTSRPARPSGSSARAAAASRPPARTMLRLLEPDGGHDRARRPATSRSLSRKEMRAAPPRGRR